jgi:hypothetical protein
MLVEAKLTRHDEAKYQNPNVLLYQYRVKLDLGKKLVSINPNKDYKLHGQPYLKLPPYLYAVPKEYLYYSSTNKD